VSEPTVSIAIVAHNNWPDLELAIESALCQSWPATEVVVIDNGSTDDTESQVTSAYASRLRYVRQGNVLDGGGYNRGIAETAGGFVQLLDGDDFLAPNKIAKQMEVFASRSEADIVYGDARQFQGQAGRPEWSDWNTGPQSDMLATLIDPAGEGAGLVIHSALFRRAALEQVGAWDESLVGADLDYWLRAAWSGCVFAYSPGAWAFHRRRPSQMSSDNNAMVNRTILTLEKALTYVDREPYRSAVRRRLAGLRYAAAVGDLRLTRQQAMSELRASRALDATRISSVPYAAGLAAVSVPGLRGILKTRPLQNLRRAFARSLGVIDS
jgi:GT2 family glycosyltransferase